MSWLRWSRTIRGTPLFVITSSPTSLFCIGIPQYQFMPVDVERELGWRHPWRAYGKRVYGGESQLDGVVGCGTGFHDDGFIDYLDPEV
ncbi:MAG: hypothetical protein ISR77_12200 [Pirellulaceae bacterium]|nr:hypothetical protein [Pirellulaceae bacterium]